MIKIINNLLLKVGKDGEIIIEQILADDERNSPEQVRIQKADIDLVICYLEHAKEEVDRK